MTEPFDLTIAQAAALIRERRLSPVALMESLLARADALEPRLQAWATLDREAALDAARRSQEELERRGPRGILHGVPIGLKDIIYTAGTRTAAGSRIWADFVPGHDATVVALLKQAGAIVQGKTVTTEFADGDPAPTLNPWDPAHTPGGSSTGSAVAVATRMCLGALGSQTVGSVQRPASYNGIVGFKPTFGRISCHGVIPYCWSCDHMGFLVRSVEDAALLLNVLAGYDSQDPLCADEPVADYHKALAALDGPPRIGVLRGYFHENSDEDTRRKLDQVVRQLGEAEAVVEEVDPGVDFREAYDAHRLVVQSETAAFHRPMFTGHEDEYGPKLRANIEFGLTRSGIEYVLANRLRQEVRERLRQALDGFDALLAPTVSAPAPRDLSSTGDTSFQSPWAFTGMPAITIPVGLASTGMPLGVQLAGPPFGEARLLAVAHWVERVAGVELVPPVASR